MKKILLLTLTLALLVALLLPTPTMAKKPGGGGGDEEHTNWATYSEYTVGAGPTSYQLLADQTIHVGTVMVSDDGSSVTVQYNVDAPWYLTETHVAVADTCAGIPQNKNGNPRVGWFPGGDDHLAMVSSVSYVLELPESLSNPICIAAHAVVVKYVGGCIVQEETAWSDGEEELYAAIDVEAYVGCDVTGSWSDADEAPGVEGVAGIHWSFKYIVTNTGDVALTSVTLTDSYLGPVSLPGDTLLPGDYFEVVLPHAAPGTPGEFMSMATATGYFNGDPYTDTDYIYITSYLP